MIHFWCCGQGKFLESMADAVKSVMDFRKYKILFINVMKDISIDCDCNSNPKPPEISDIGILSSLDPVALDQACVDLVYNSPGEKLKIGTRQYELINLDTKI